MDTFDQEIALYESMFDASVNNAINLYQINCFTESVDSTFMESGIVSKAIAFGKKIKDAIVSFFKKTKDAIKRKIQDVKLDKAIKAIKKSGIKDTKMLNVEMTSSTDLFEKLAKTFISTTARYADKIKKAKTLDEVQKIRKEFDDYYNSKACGSEGLNSKETAEFVSLAGARSIIEEKSMERMEEAAEATVNKMIDIMDDIENKMNNKKIQESANLTAKKDDTELMNSKKSALQQGVMKSSGFFKKIGSKIAQNKGKCISAIVALAAAGGVALYQTGNKKGYNKGYHEGYHEGKDTGFYDGWNKGLIDGVTAVKNKKKSK